MWWIRQYQPQEWSKSSVGFVDQQPGSTLGVQDPFLTSFSHPTRVLVPNLPPIPPTQHRRLQAHAIIQGHKPLPLTSCPSQQHHMSLLCVSTYLSHASLHHIYHLYKPNLLAIGAQIYFIQTMFHHHSTYSQPSFTFSQCKTLRASLRPISSRSHATNNRLLLINSPLC